MKMYVIAFQAVAVLIANYLCYKAGYAKAYSKGWNDRCKIAPVDYLNSNTTIKKNLDGSFDISIQNGKRESDCNPEN